MICACKQVLHKLLQKDSRSMNIFLQIIIVRSDQRISEIPWIVGENLIANMESEKVRKAAVRQKDQAYYNSNHAAREAAEQQRQRNDHRANQ